MGDLKRRIHKAVTDPVLTQNVLRATDTSLRHRDETVEERSDWEDLRERAAAIKDHTLDHLDEYIEQFVENARQRGCHVYLARDGAQACRIITEIARKNGCSRILKSKSMATEEVELNRAFEARGYTPLETDLGEYIVQLAGEPPSHITAPALHRSTEQIFDLFREQGVLDGRGEPPTDRVELATWLSLQAREHLRSRLLDADLGISGGNFLVAATGTVVTVENEGNIRFTTTTPPLHVALVGIEKMIPRIEDLGTFLPLLTRSATGQRITTYVSMFSGGPAELHIVLLDNGRSRMMADPADREILRCIRCGACLNICPVYRTVGGHAYGSTYPGPIGALVTPLLRGREEDRELPFVSSLCGACTAICPVKIDLHGHLLRLREAEVARPSGFLTRLFWRGFRFAMAKPARYRQLMALARVFERPAVAAGIMQGWTRFREAPRLAPRPFSEMWRDDGSSDR